MPLRILSIDGGGTRGIIPATILDCIHKDFGKSPLELFDLFAGTSTGGILCTLLAAGIAPEQMVHLYLENSAEIFSETYLDELQPVDELVQANYSHTKFKAILENMLGNRTLGQLHADPAFGGEHKKLMVCSFDLAPDDPSDRNQNYRPAIFHSSFIKCKDTRLVDLCLMTSAGPTYFPIYGQRFIDGGVALNNPSMAAITFAINKHQNGTEYLYPDGVKKGLGLELDDLQLFSLSTGTGNQNRIDPNRVGTGNWGKITWIKYLPDLLTETNMQSTLYYVKQVLNHEGQFYRVELYFNDPEAPEVLKTYPVGLDAKHPDVLKAMHQFALDTYARQKTAIASFLKLS